MDDCPDDELEVMDDDKAMQQLMLLAENLDELFNANDPGRTTGFMLLVNYRCGPAAERSSVVSNMEPMSLKMALKLQLARLEGQSFGVGHA